MSVSPTVLVACDDLILLDEVIRHLEEIPSWRLVMSARTADEALNHAGRPDCMLVSDGLIEALARDPRSERLSAGIVVFGRQESAPALRAALTLGARGFVQWPEDRDQLRPLVERGMAVSQAPVQHPSGSLHAVWAPKGGAGATVVAAHLAGAFANALKVAVLVDLDLDHGDQTCVLGADAGTKTVGDLLRVSDELSPNTVSSVLCSHPLGFRAVLAPGRPGDNTKADPEGIRRVLRSIVQAAEHVVVDLPSGTNPVALAALHDATSIQVVLTPDLLALRRARDLMKDLFSSGVEVSRVNVVLNQAGGPDITAKEVEAVLGVGSVIRVRADFQIYRAANRGELSPLGCKLLAPLARRLIAQAAAPAPAAPPQPAMPKKTKPPEPSIAGRLDQARRRVPARTKS